MSWGKLSECHSFYERLKIVKANLEVALESVSQAEAYIPNGFDDVSDSLQDLTGKLVGTLSDVLDELGELEVPKTEGSVQ